jgi:hypothetical protein
MEVAWSHGSTFGRTCGAMTVGFERTSWRRGLSVVGSCGGAVVGGNVGR